MRLNEFYSPEDDNATKRDKDDVRKRKFTLEELNKLRKYRDIKNAEKVEHDKFVRTMYATPAEGGEGGLV